MKKLKLEDLRVDSFVTSGRDVPRGTVGAHQSPPVCTGYLSTCGGNGSTADYLTCPGGASDDTYCGGTPVCSLLGTGPCPTYGDTCNGHTGCGSCAPALTCDLQYGCGGTSFDLQAC